MKPGDLVTIRVIGDNRIRIFKDYYTCYYVDPDAYDPGFEIKSFNEIAQHFTVIASDKTRAEYCCIFVLHHESGAIGWLCVDNHNVITIL